MHDVLSDAETADVAPGRGSVVRVWREKSGVKAFCREKRGVSHFMSSCGSSRKREGML